MSLVLYWGVELPSPTAASTTAAAVAQMAPDAAAFRQLFLQYVDMPITYGNAPFVAAASGGADCWLSGRLPKVT